MKRKIWVLLLALMLAICTAGLSACFGGSSDWDALVIYALSSDGETAYVEKVQGYNLPEDDRTLTIADEYEGKPVTSMADDAFEYSSGNITALILPSSLTEISNHVLWSISGIYDLERVVVDERNPAFRSKDGILYNKEETEILVVPQAIKGDVTIADGVTDLNEHEFYYREFLESIIIPDSVQTIGDEAFGYCKSLKSVTIGNGVTSIGEEAFHECASLESVVIPDSVKTIGDEAFGYCKSLKSVTIGKGLTEIDSNAFNTDLSLAEINYNATECAVLGFHDLRYSSVFSIHEVYEAISDGIKLTIGFNVKKIPAFIFAHSQINEVVLEENSERESIGEMAFYFCDSLTGIEIPSKINYIGKNAFFGCLLTEIKYNAVNCTTLDVEDGEDGVFSTDMFITDNIEDYWEIIEKNEGYAKVTVGAKVKAIPANLFSEIYVTEVEFEEGSLCESIGEEAFYYSSLSVINLDVCKSLKSIGAEAFFHCWLTELTIPSNVENIGRSAFSDCSQLTDVKYNARYAQLDEK